MRIERLAFLLVGLAAGAAAAPLEAQDPLTSVNAATQVKSLKFRFAATHTLDEQDLRAQLATTPRGRFVWLQKILSWLPAIPPPATHPFDPLALQRDVVRLRHFYERNGFPDAEIDYLVRYEADANLADITFVVREGPPLGIASLVFEGIDSSPQLLAPELEPQWRRFVEREQERGGRWTEDRERRLADSTTRWLRNRGYPFAVATTKVAVDTAVDSAAVVVHVEPGTRGRIGEIVVTGNTTVPAGHLSRQLPVKAGDWFNAAQLEQGRKQLMQFDLVRLALVQVSPQSRQDSSVAVHLQVTENHPRLIRGELGLSSGAGIGGQADWTHRSFLGGLRTLTLGLGAQTGLIPLESPARQEFRLALSAFEPYVGNRRISLALGPFGEYRNDLRDRSWRVGMQSSIVFATGPLRSLALGYTFAHRRILDYGFGNIEPIQYLPLLGLATPDAVGTLGHTFDHSILTLGGSWGRLDRFASPRKGFVVRPRLELTTPFLNTNKYALMEVGASFFIPLRRRFGATIRGGAGRIFPFGTSAADGSPFVALLRLRDVTFTAGGTRDVRGWGADLLGPKLPKVELQTVNGTPTYVAHQYAPVGGLARAVASAQVNVPIPGLGERLQSFFFVDGARVWTPDDRFRVAGEGLVQDRFFVGTGGGVGYQTLVGAVEVAVGYKLNPSALDLRDPNAVMNALANGGSLSDVPTDARRRWQLHFSIGATF